jgi:hypothetical protein
VWCERKTDSKVFDLCNRQKTVRFAELEKGVREGALLETKSPVLNMTQQIEI